MALFLKHKQIFFQIKTNYKNLQQSVSAHEMISDQWAQISCLTLSPKCSLKILSSETGLPLRKNCLAHSGPSESGGKYPHGAKGKAGHHSQAQPEKSLKRFYEGP